MGMSRIPPRNQIDLNEHARRNRINPAIDLDANGEKTGPRQRRLQTMLLPENLQTRMGAIRDLARLSEQEMGFSTLHVAFGFLEWFEKEESEKALFAPLLLLPVKLAIRTDAGKKIYGVRATSEGASHNVTLKKRLEELHRSLPEFDPEGDAARPIESYFDRVGAAVHGLPRWRVRRFLVLGHFAFGRLAMYQDLDPAGWGISPSEHELVGAILRGAETVVNGEGDAQPRIPEDYEIDGPEVERLAPLLVHDADASQHSAIVDAMKRENLVIGGPPGTGKSQTITNIIANALARDGATTVLFLSEKRAALEVVKRRLDVAGLGTFCLELHSEKSSPRGVVESLKERLAGVPVPRPANPMSPDAWNDARSTLADYLGELHAPDEDGDSAFDLFWRSVAAGEANADLPREVRRGEIPVEILAHPERQRRLLADMRNFGDLAEDFSSRRGPRTGSPWARLALRARPGEHEDVLDALESLRRAISDAIAVAGELAERSLPHDDLDGLRDVARLPAPPGLEGVERLARVDLEQAAQAAALFQTLRRLDAELAADPLNGRVGGDELKAAARLAQDLWEPNLSDLPAPEIVRRADETVRLAERAMRRVDDTRRLRVLIGVDDGEPVEILLAVYAAAIVASAVPPDMRAWLSWKPAGEGSADARYSQARDRWFVLSEADRLWAGRLRGYDPAVRPNASEAREAARVLAEKNVGLKPWRRAAFKNAKNVASRLGLEPPNAEALLSDLAEHLDAVAVFERDPSAAQAVGALWRGLRTEFGAMDNARKTRAFIAEKLARYGHGGKVAEALFGIDERALAEIATQRDLASATLNAAVVDDVGAARGLSIGQAYEATRRNRDLARTVSTSESARVLADVAVPLRALLARANREDEHARLAARISGIAASEAVGPLVRNQEDAARVLAVIEWIGKVRACGLSEEAARSLLSADGAKVREDLISVAERAITSSEAENTATAAVATRYGLTFPGRAREQIREALSAALDRASDLREFLTLNEAHRRLEEAGLRGFLQVVEATDLTPTRYADVLEYVVVRRRAERLHRSRPNLNDSSGVDLSSRRRIFADHDRRKTAHDRFRAHAALSTRRPPAGANIGSPKRWTEMELIDHEKEKEKGFLNVRALLRQAAASFQALKPCFMMSPMSVSKFLPKEMKFDLVIIDEASQMRPEDAVGALLRARQMVVVGDPKQLPPTDFFDRAMDGDEADDGEETDDVDDESILESCAKSFNKVRNLKWHYRSRCESLIAFSNEQFYAGSLITFPMARPGSFSIDLVRVEGVYQASQNPAESQRICEEVIALMERLADAADVDFGTIGVVAVNSKQSELIRSQFESLSAGNLSVERYMEKCENLGEPFFVKNLENVQGDERDFIMISLTYGRAPGKKAVDQRFGPINRSQGHRRLNVLFSRARRRIGLFTSMAVSDIRPTPTSKPGVHVLKAYLEYAERGATAGGVPTGKSFESPFERQVAQRLMQRGFEVDVQVGVSGFRIDLAVKHRERTSVYVAGVECDGASYHSSRSARDRDRLREEVLRGLGWNIVRIWSTDWFSDPDDATERLVAEILRLEQRPIRDEAGVVFGRRTPEAPSVPEADATAETEPVPAATMAEFSKPLPEEPVARPVIEAEPSLLSGTGPLSRAEARRALEELKRTVIEVEMPEAEPHRGILREAMIEHFIGVRFVDRDSWFDRVPTHLRQGCDPAQKRYLDRICDVINRIAN
jgi:very-short-patch-repair endonuclease